MNLNTTRLSIDAMYISIIIFILMLAGAICVSIAMYIALTECTDFYNKRISKNLIKGDFYKAAMLYKKYNPQYSDFRDDLKEEAFNNFVNVFYSFMKNNFDRSTLSRNILDFLSYYIKPSYTSLYYMNENTEIRKYLDKKIDFMLSSIEPVKESWYPVDLEMSMYFLILFLQDNGFLKFKEPEKVSFYWLLEKSDFEKLYDLMDDCMIKDAIVKALNYSKHTFGKTYVWEENE